MPLSRKSNREKVDQVATAGARTTTGCPAGTGNRVVMAEANIRSISSLADEQGAVLREKILRLPPDVPAKQTVTREIKKRLTNGQTWREEATKIAREAQLEDVEREPVTLPYCPPWLSSRKGMVSFHTEAGYMSSRNDAPGDSSCGASTELPTTSRLHLLTDGSSEGVLWSEVEE